MFGDLIFSKRIACLYIQNIKKSSVSYMVLGEVQIFQARKDPYFTLLYKLKKVQVWIYFKNQQGWL